MLHTKQQLLYKISISEIINTLRPGHTAHGSWKSTRFGARQEPQEAAGSEQGQKRRRPDEVAAGGARRPNNAPEAGQKESNRGREGGHEEGRSHRQEGSRQEECLQEVRKNVVQTRGFAVF